MANSDNTLHPHAYEGGDRLIAGIVLAVVTFWLFAQTTLNVLPAMRTDLRIGDGISDIAVSITALFSGIFIVVAGGLADRFGRVKMTYVGLALSIVGSLLIAASPCGTATFLLAGRIIQGVSAACIMPATLALMKAYYGGAARQRALSFWSIGSWGGSGLCALLGGLVDATMGWRSIFWMSIIVATLSWSLIRGTPESRADAEAVTQPGEDRHTPAGGIGIATSSLRNANLALSRLTTRRPWSTCCREQSVHVAAPRSYGRGHAANVRKFCASSFEAVICRRPIYSIPPRNYISL